MCTCIFGVLGQVGTSPFHAARCFLQRRFSILRCASDT